MSTVTLSPKFQIVIPKAVRKAMKLAPGEKLTIMRYGERVEILRVRSAKQMRGFLQGMNTTIEREMDRL
jgi:AbrB family looped-hinge helix DNA binding protein